MLERYLVEGELPLQYVGRLDFELDRYTGGTITGVWDDGGALQVYGMNGDWMLVNGEESISLYFRTDRMTVDEAVELLKEAYLYDMEGEERDNAAEAIKVEVTR